MSREHHLIDDDHQGHRRWLVTEFVICTATVHDTLAAAKLHGCQCPTAKTIRNRYEKARRCGIIRTERDATGTTRRLQALAVDGWSSTALAPRLGLNPVTVSNLRRGHHTTVFGSTAEKVAAVYSELAGTPGPSERTRGHATRQQWAGYEVWGDRIDDPDAVAGSPVSQLIVDIDPVAIDRAVNGESVSLTPPEAEEVLGRLHAAGRSYQDMAAAVGRNTRWVHRHLTRLGLTATQTQHHDRYDDQEATA